MSTTSTTSTATSTTPTISTMGPPPVEWHIGGLFNGGDHSANAAPEAVQKDEGGQQRGRRRGGASQQVARKRRPVARARERVVRRARPQRVEQPLAEPREPVAQAQRLPARQPQHPLGWGISSWGVGWGIGRIGLRINGRSGRSGRIPS